jgi:hypothetical protein
VTSRRLGFAGLLALLVAATPAPPEDRGVELTFLNQTHTNLDIELAPIQEGPLAIHLSSPSHQMTLHRNRLVLRPSASEDPDAWVTAEFEGAGDLVAEVEGASLATRLRDHVVAPRQVVQLRGKARVTRNAEGYTLRVVEAPPSVPVRIRSGVVGRCVALCRGLGLFAMVDCARLERALSTVQVPLRSDQATLRLPRAQLSATDRAYLDRFVPPSEPRGPSP